MYAGKPESGAGPYYINNTDDSVKSLVSGLMAKCPLGGRNWTMDRLYGSVPITQWLLENNMTATCTMRHDRRGLPTENLKDGKNHIPLSKTIHYEKVRSYIHPHHYCKIGYRFSNGVR